MAEKEATWSVIWLASDYRIIASSICCFFSGADLHMMVAEPEKVSRLFSLFV